MTVWFVVGPVLALVVMSTLGWVIASAPKRRRRRLMRQMTEDFRRLQVAIGHELNPAMQRIAEAMGRFADAWNGRAA